MARVSARDEAAALIADGWRVWPISRGTKKPARAGFARSNGPVCASVDEFTDAVEVGVLCGPCDAAGPDARFVCVDYDGPVPPEARVGGEPTLTTKDGAHAWYRVPPDVSGFRQSAGLRRGDGWAVDTRDYGGYAIETRNGEPLWDYGPAQWPRDLTQAEVDALCGVPAPTTQPSVRQGVPQRTACKVRPSRAWVNAFVARVVGTPERTNDCLGACGAALADSGWSNEEIGSALNTWFGTFPLGRHRDSALRAADTRRAAVNPVPCFPRLAELGIPWQEERPAEITAAEMLEAAGAEAPPRRRAGLGSAEPPFHWISAREIVQYELPPVAWLCQALALAPGAPALCTGYSGTGKTTTLQDLAISVATPGRRFLNTYEVRHGRVAHIDLEQGTNQTMATYKALGLTADAQLQCSVLPQWLLTDLDSQLALAKAAAQCVLVIIDSFRVACLGLDENSSEFAEPLKFLGQLSELTGCVFMLNHHSGKNNADRMKSARGTSAITAACSVHWSFEREDLKPTTRPCLELVKSRQHTDERATVWETYVEKATEGAGRFSLWARANAGAGTPADDIELEASILETVRSGPIRNLKELSNIIGRRHQDVCQAAKRLNVVYDMATRALAVII